MTRKSFISKVLLAVGTLTLATAISMFASAHAREEMDLAIREMIELALQSLPNDTKVSYEGLDSDSERNSLNFWNLRIFITKYENTKAIMVGRATISGIDLKAIFSSTPLVIDKIYISDLLVIEMTDEGARRWGAENLTVGGLRIPALDDASSVLNDPMGFLTQIKVSRLNIDGRFVTSAKQALELLQK